MILNLVQIFKGIELSEFKVRAMLWASIAVGAFGLALSIFDVSDGIRTEWPVLEPVLRYVKFLVALCFLSLIFFLVLILFVGVAELLQKSAPIIPGLGCEKCKEEDLEEVHSLATSALTTIPSLEETIRIYRHNKHVIHKVIDSRNGGIIVGYFAILPLTRAGVEKLESNTFVVSKGDLSVFARRGLPRGQEYYLGAAVAHEIRAKGSITDAIRNFCIERRVTRLFSRPTTEDGLRSLKKNGFKPAVRNEKPAIGVIFVAKLD